MKTIKIHEMKMIQGLIMIVFVLVQIQCAGNYKENSSEIDSTFNEFFEKFSSDPEFQLDRINFPISYWSYDIEDALSKVEIKKEDWDYINFLEDQDAVNREVDAFKPKIKKVSEEDVMYIRAGIDNGIQIEYHFYKDSSNWQLVKIIDKST